MTSEELVVWLLEQGFDGVPAEALALSEEDLEAIDCLILNGYSAQAFLLAKSLIYHEVVS